MIDKLYKLNILTQKGVNPKFKVLIKKHQLLEELYTHTNFLSKDATERERIYCILNGICEMPVCLGQHCNNRVRFILDGKKRNEYYQYCSLACSNKSLDVQNKKKESYVTTLGVDNPSKSEHVKQQKIRTSLSKYGTEYPWQNNSIKENKKQNVFKEYNVYNVMQLPDVKNKNLTSKLNSTWYKQTLNTPYYQQLNNYDWLIEQHHELKLTTAEIAEKLNISPTLVQRKLHQYNVPIKHFFQSVGERQVGEYVISLGLDIITNDRTLIPPYELDIFIPQLSMAIEFNGDYWHGDLFPKTQKRDLEKNKKCKENKILLFTISESEWNTNQDSVKSKLNNTINKRKGIPRTDTVKQKISETKTNNNNIAWNKGIQKTSIQKKKQSDTMKQKYKSGEIIHWNTGKSTSEQTKQKISNSLLKQERTYNETSKLKRDITYQTKKESGWQHHSTLNKGNPRNLSEESQQIINETLMHNNVLKKEDSELRIIEHLNNYDILLKGIDTQRYNYTLECTKCNTQFSRTKSVLVPYRYELYQGEYCPTCYPKSSGCYNTSFFDSHPEYKDVRGVLYLIMLENEDEAFLKVGITKRDTQTRWQHESNYRYMPILEIPMTMYEAFNVEQRILSDNQSYIPKLEFGGKTECFSLELYDNIINSFVKHLPSHIL